MSGCSEFPPATPVSEKIFSAFSFRSDLPTDLPQTHVEAIEAKLQHHMDEMALGR